MPFELNTKNVYLTYPKCSVSTEDAYKDLFLRFTPEKLLVAHEFHADGTDHLHCYMLLSKAICTKNCHYYDILGHHGNYQGCRSPKKVLQYCSKGGDFKANFDVMLCLSSVKPDRATIAGELLKKRPITEVVEEYPQLLFGYNRLKLDVESFFFDKVSSNDSLYHWLPNPWGLLLSSRIRTKKRHYWIYSDKPNLGKTYQFALPLSKACKVVIRTGDEPYWSGLSSDTECIILDEYNAAIFKFYQLNAMADGTYAYRRFQMGVISLNNPLIIVLSNVSISIIYPNKCDLIYARFKEIKLD